MSENEDMSLFARLGRGLLWGLYALAPLQLFLGISLVLRVLLQTAEIQVSGHVQFAWVTAFVCLVTMLYVAGYHTRGMSGYLSVCAAGMWLVMAAGTALTAAVIPDFGNGTYGTALFNTIIAAVILWTGLVRRSDDAA